MGEMLEKMSNVLSDPESVKQLQELAQMLQQEEDEENGSNSADAAQNADSEGGGLDLSMLLRVQELMGAVQSQDEDAKLLLALRPHVQERKQKKIDQAKEVLWHPDTKHILRSNKNQNQSGRLCRRWNDGTIFAAGAKSNAAGCNAPGE